MAEPGKVDQIVIGVVTGAICLAIGFVAGAAMEWRRKVRFHLSGWKLQSNYVEASGGYGTDDCVPAEVFKGENIIYSFKIKIFNEKSKPIGLHRIAVEFTKGPWYNRRIVARHENLRCGDEKRRGEGNIPYRDPLERMDLEPHKWAVADVFGVIEVTVAFKEADAVWFVAHSASGKRFKKRIFRWEMGREGDEPSRRSLLNPRPCPGHLRSNTPPAPALERFRQICRKRLVRPVPVAPARPAVGARADFGARAAGAGGCAPTVR